MNGNAAFGQEALMVSDNNNVSDVRASSETCPSRIYLKLKNEIVATKFVVDDLRTKATQLRENISTGKVRVAMATLDMGQRDHFERQIENAMAKLNK